MSAARSEKDARSGVALLVALATLVLVLASAALLARAASTTALRREMDRSQEIADDLLRPCEDFLLSWLKSSETIALGPDVSEPRIPVVRRGWQAAGLFHELTITAWDQEGLVPYAWCRQAPWSGTLPEAFRTAMRENRGRPGDPLGLDLWEDAESLPSPYPSASGADPPALGGRVSVLATRQPRINVATAPMALVRAALRAAGRGGEELIEAARAKGERPKIAPDAPGVERLEGVPEIATESESFSFRIDVRVGKLARSWWWTYAREGASAWRCVQRLGISS